MSKKTKDKDANGDSENMRTKEIPYEFRDILRLIHEVRENELTSFQLECGDFQLKIKREREPQQIMLRQETAAGSQPIPTAEILHANIGAEPSIPSLSGAKPEKEEAAPPEEKYSVQKAPLVGTFYRQPAPDSDPYVELGDIVAKGRVLCIIGAMKVMNEIESDHSGRIVKIVPEDSHPVEFGQALFHIEPM